MLFPKSLLRQLYTRGSLKNTEEGISFSIKNRLANATLTAVKSIKINDTEIELDNLVLDFLNGQAYSPNQISKQNSIDFPLKKTINIVSKDIDLKPGSHKISIHFQAKPFGKLQFDVEDEVDKVQKERLRIPRLEEADYEEEIIQKRQNFIETQSQIKLHHLKQFSFNPPITQGNCENFTGVAQIPMGFAGPIHIIGEHATGEYFIPLATTEGSLVASYNRGMQAINESGGVRCTVIEDAMQRAPVFVFGNAQEARDFGRWVETNFAKLKKVAEETSNFAKLMDIDQYVVSRVIYLRFNFTTGDAAGQNMVGKATLNACQWVIQNYSENQILNFYLEANFATDKKASQINMLKVRGKKVVAECTFKKDILLDLMKVDSKKLATHANIANLAAFLAHTNNNGLHAANALAAMFIATGQDVANVAESSAGVLHTELTPEEDLYLSITLPSLIVATYGGGTRLATQKECLEVLGCYGKDKVYKFAEIVAGVVLAGEISLASAISSSDWVESHERFGRNR